MFTVLAAALLLTTSAALPTASPRTASSACEDRRPPPEERKFVSPVVDAFIEQLSANMTDQPELACLFRNTLPNTLDTTVQKGSCANCTFVVTGDINAMWLRDSTNQVLPYLRFASADAKLRQMLGGLLRQQTLFVLEEPYANAFYLANDPSMSTPNTNDDTTARSPLCVASGGNCSYAGTRVKGMKPGIYERKYELDSLCAFLKLGRSLHAVVPVYSATASYFDASWRQAVHRVLDVIETMQSSSALDARSPCGPAYTFTRSNLAGQGPLDTLLKGVGPPAAATGMSRSAFRPSDDACTYNFLVPANAMAVVELKQTAMLLREMNAQQAATESTRVRDDPADDPAALAARCERLAESIQVGIEEHGVVSREALGGQVYAYEVDGFGNANMMDDANIPSLLSLPWLGYVPSHDPTYQRTRRYVLSPLTNPWFFNGTAGEGVGSPHTGAGFVWPMGLIMRALTATSDDEISACLTTLQSSAAVPDSWMMHESFKADDASSFTRPWFAWANSLFGELIIRLATERPHLLGMAVGVRAGLGELQTRGLDR